MSEPEPTPTDPNQPDAPSTDAPSTDDPAERENEATRERLIEATIVLLDQRGNHALRLADVARDTGVAVSTIYAHFKDRTDLVAAARLRQFKSHADEALAAVELGLSTMDRSSAANLSELVSWPSLRSPQDDESRTRRWDRIQAMADARHIPVLYDELVQLQSALTERATELARRAQEKGILDPTLDPAALALLTQVLRLGLALWDLSGDARPDPAAWEHLVQRLVDATTPPAAAPTTTLPTTTLPTPPDQPRS